MNELAAGKFTNGWKDSKGKQVKVQLCDCGDVKEHVHGRIRDNRKINADEAALEISISIGKNLSKNGLTSNLK